MIEEGSAAWWEARSGEWMKRAVERQSTIAQMREALELVLRDVGHGGPTSDYVSTYTVERIREALGLKDDEMDRRPTNATTRPAS